MKNYTVEEAIEIMFDAFEIDEEKRATMRNDIKNGAESLAESIEQEIKDKS